MAQTPLSAQHSIPWTTDEPTSAYLLPTAIKDKQIKTSQQKNSLLKRASLSSIVNISCLSLGWGSGVRRECTLISTYKTRVAEEINTCLPWNSSQWDFYTCYYLAPRFIRSRPITAPISWKFPQEKTWELYFIPHPSFFFLNLLWASIINVAFPSLASE